MNTNAGTDRVRELPPGADAASPLLEISGLRVSFALSDGHRLTAVDGINLSVAPGEAVGLAGESGSGEVHRGGGDHGAAGAERTH